PAHDAGVWRGALGARALRESGPAIDRRRAVSRTRARGVITRDRMLMSTRRHRLDVLFITGVLRLALCGAGATAPAQRTTGTTPRRPARGAKPPATPAKPPATTPKPPVTQTAPASPIQAVRVALGHAAPDAAQKLADQMTGPNHDLAVALVDIYKGDDDGAR